MQIDFPEPEQIREEITRQREYLARLKKALKIALAVKKPAANDRSCLGSREVAHA
jgi:hypothetical protein